MGGREAVGGSHLSRPIQTGPIGNARLQMVLDDSVVLRGAVMTNFTIGHNHTLTLRLIDDAGKQFRGFLFRLGPGTQKPFLDTTDALDSVNREASVAYEHCVIGQGVGGITHTNAELKSNITGILRMDETANYMPLDVTVVIQNRGITSEFYYQQFTLNAVQGPAPVESPTLPSTTPAPALPDPASAPSTSPPVPTAAAPVTSMPVSRAPTTSMPVTMRPITAAPATSMPVTKSPTTPPPTTEKPTTESPVSPTSVTLAVRKDPPLAAKCGSLAAANGLGGAGAQAKDCSRVSSRGNTRRLKGR